MRVILVDSHDSFVHNLAQALQANGAFVTTVQSNEVGAQDVLRQRPDRLVLGPGPGRPEESGCLVPLVRAALGAVPLLGVCLGHQALALALGGSVQRHHRAVHGLAEPVEHDGRGLFRGLPPAVPMTRYHSLVVDPNTLPPDLHVSAWAHDGAVMAMRHTTLAAASVQFHPESVLSGEPGLRLLAHFMKMPTAGGVPFG